LAVPYRIFLNFPFTLDLMCPWTSIILRGFQALGPIKKQMFVKVV